LRDAIRDDCVTWARIGGGWQLRLCHPATVDRIAAAFPYSGRDCAANRDATRRKNALMKSKYHPDRDPDRRFLVGFEMRFKPFSNGQGPSELMPARPRLR
jgi:hypothetical protein